MPSGKPYYPWLIAKIRNKSAINGLHQLQLFAIPCLTLTFFDKETMIASRSGWINHQRFLLEGAEIRNPACHAKARAKAG